MSCEPIRMNDGTVVLANVKKGETLTEGDKKIISEWVEFCRERSRKAQRLRNLGRGKSSAPPNTQGSDA